MAHLHRFYVPPDTVGADSAVGCTITLSGREAHHACHVVRVRPGEDVILLDGCGRELSGVVLPHSPFQEAAPGCQVEIRGDLRHPVPSCRLTLIPGWLNREKLTEDLIRRVTEIGVSSIRFFKACHSERTPQIKEKWTQIAIEACKQCGNPRLPVFEAASSLSDALDSLPLAEDPTDPAPRDRATDPPRLLLVATNRVAPVPLRRVLQEAGLPAGHAEVGLIVGPEGDLSGEELELAFQRGAVPVSFGPRTFRSEVAASLACALVLYELGSLGPLG